MRILGIESSCDETAAAVVRDDGKTARRRAFQRGRFADRHPRQVRRRGPELASREHLRAIVPVVREALAGRYAAGGPFRHRRDRGAGSGRVATGGPHLRQEPELCGRRGPADRREPHRRAHPCRDSGGAPGGHSGGVSRARAGRSGGHTHLFEVRGDGSVPSAGPHPRRRRRGSLRQGRQTARPGLSWRARHRPAGAVWQSPRRFHSPLPG